MDQFKTAPTRGLAGVALLTMTFFTACATAPPQEDLPTAESYYHEALTLLEGSSVMLLFSEVDYPRAIELFQEVIDNYPYSEFALLAELKIADVHFEQGDYEDARGYYQDFTELHPKHPQVPYAIYQNGLCSFNQIGDKDQDQGPAHDAIELFRVLIELHPTTEYAALARDRLRESLDTLAQHDIDVGHFYFNREEYHAAVLRYRRAIERYPQHTTRPQTLILLATALKRLHEYDDAERVLRAFFDEGLQKGLDDESAESVRELIVDLVPAAAQKNN